MATRVSDSRDPTHKTKKLTHAPQSNMPAT